MLFAILTTRRQEETALRESEEHYRRFVTQDFTGTLSILPNGQIVTCNPAFANIFGFDSIEEAISGNFIELLRRYGVPIGGAHAVVIGRGLTIGRPLALLLAMKRPGWNTGYQMVKW